MITSAIKVLVTGADGQLGSDVIKELINKNIGHVGVTRSNFDLTNSQAVKKFIFDYQPSCIIHCGAYTAVDKAENEKELCYNTNVLATENLVMFAKELDCKFIYISTDYVFDGKGTFGWEIDDTTNPINYYGYTKMLGEEAVKKLDKYFIVRISWVFGKNGKNFVKTMLSLASSYSSLSIVADQVGSPTYTKDLATLLITMSFTNRYGIYHATNEGYCSWFDFAKSIFDLANISIDLQPVDSKDYRTIAARPLNSRLSKKSLDNNGFNRLPPWEAALKKYFEGD